MVLLPRGKKVRRTKRWNHWTHPLPNRWLCPNEACAPRTEQPFVCSSRKRVASQRGDLWIFHAKTVHTVNDQQHTILFVAAAVYFRQRLSDPGDVPPVAANVVGDRAAYLQRNVLVSLHENRALNGKQRIGINSCPILFYRSAHRSGVRGQKE